MRNSLVGGQSELVPLPSERSEMTWYSCGPTVYDSAHLGHARTYICTDAVRRILTDVLDIDVNFAMGVTDIDDKIITRAATQGIPWRDLAARYEEEFMADMKRLNVRPPDAILRVTEHVPDIINYVEALVKSGIAYESDRGVYFSVQKFGSSYGKLNQGALEDVLDTVAAEGTDKVDKRDFALWKKSDTAPHWNSPWGLGRPGWHIECSAMTHAYFGASVDIHSGGVDLAFPHHTNEIAQW